MATYNAPVAEGGVLTMGYTGTIDTVNILKDGLYKLEVWGGIGYLSGGVYGGYSVGYKYIKKGNVLYAGCAGDSTDANGGFNGGGSSNRTSGGGHGPASGGGGATHIALNANRGVLANYSSYRSEILIVAGGSGGGTTGSWDSDASPGGSGGGLQGGDSMGFYGGGRGGTQTTGYDGASFGYGATTYTDDGATHGGGGGWYGGGFSWGRAGGGSGYIGGVPTITYRGTSYSPSTSNNVSRGSERVRITLIQKSVPTIYFNTGQIDALLHGSIDIADVFYNATQL